MEYTKEDIQRLYESKLSKYAPEEIDDDLCDALFFEAMKEIMCASRLNGGRRIKF